MIAAVLVWLTESQGQALPKPGQRALAERTLAGHVSTNAEMHTARDPVAIKAHPVRELIDPVLGLHWQLLVDPLHPASPGRWVLVGSNESVPPLQMKTVAYAAQIAPIASHPVAPVWAIRSGERVTVEQQTPALHAELQAVALASGVVGDRVKVRLKAGKEAAMSTEGAVIVVVVTGRGAASW